MSQLKLDAGVLSQIREASRMVQQVDVQMLEQASAMYQSTEPALANMRLDATSGAVQAYQQQLAEAGSNIMALVGNIDPKMHQYVVEMERLTAIVNADVSGLYNRFKEAETVTGTILSQLADTQIAAAPGIAALNVVDGEGIAGIFRQIEPLHNTGLNAIIAFQEAAAPPPQIFNPESAWATQLTTMQTGLSGFYDNILPSVAGLIHDTVEPFAARMTEWANVTSGIEQTAAEYARAIDSIVETWDMGSAAAIGMSASVPDHIRNSLLIDMPMVREPQPWAMPPTLPSRVIDWDDEPEPPPSGGICYQELNLSRGTITHLGNLLRHFWSIEHSPAKCFVLRHEDDNYWHIYYCEETDPDARERVVARTEPMGYICGIDLPNPCIQFFAYSEKAWERITPSLLCIKKMMQGKGFKFLVKAENKRGLTAGVELKLQELRKKREEHKVNGVITISRSRACHLVGIDTKTVRKHAAFLYERWDDWEI